MPSGSVQPNFSSSVVMVRSSGQKVAAKGALEPAGPPGEEPLDPVACRHLARSGCSCTTVSIIDSGAGSVADSARPILPWTLTTSGNVAISLSDCWSSSLLLVMLMLGSVVGMYSRSPSSSGGMNSVPSRVNGIDRRRQGQHRHDDHRVRVANGQAEERLVEPLHEVG